MKTENFALHGVNEFSKGRAALVRSTVALAIGYQVARGIGAEKPDTMAGEAFKTALKSMMRDAGNDRKTADRHVNTAVSLSAKLVDRYSGRIEVGRSEVAIVNDITATALASGAKSVAALKRLVQTGSADQEAETVKSQDGKELKAETKAEKAARLEEQAQGMADTLAGRIANADLDAAPMEEEAPQIETETPPAPETASLPFQSMTDAQLDQLIKDATKERQRRIDEAAKVQLRDAG